jgi:hypothetical protein
MILLCLDDTAVSRVPFGHPLSLGLQEFVHKWLHSQFPGAAYGTCGATVCKRPAAPYSMHTCFVCLAVPGAAAAQQIAILAQLVLYHIFWHHTGCYQLHTTECAWQGEERGGNGWQANVTGIMLLDVTVVQYSYGLLQQ